MQTDFFFKFYFSLHSLYLLQKLKSTLKWGFWRIYPNLTQPSFKLHKVVSFHADLMLLMNLAKRAILLNTNSITKKPFKVICLERRSMYNVYIHTNVCSENKYTKQSSVLWLSYRFFEEFLFPIANLSCQKL